MNYSKIHLENNSGLSLHKGQHMNEENMIWQKLDQFFFLVHWIMFNSL
jgi:hypothetical protein